MLAAQGSRLRRISGHRPDPGHALPAQPATQVAEWAGNSVKVVMEVYAGCIDGQTGTALRRLMAAVDEDEGEAA
jgi:hypothetical protein